MDDALFRRPHPKPSVYPHFSLLPNEARIYRSLIRQLIIHSFPLPNFLLLLLQNFLWSVEKLRINLILRSEYIPLAYTRGFSCPLHYFHFLLLLLLAVWFFWSTCSLETFDVWIVNYESCAECCASQKDKNLEGIGVMVLSVVCCCFLNFFSLFFNSVLRCIMIMIATKTITAGVGGHDPVYYVFGLQ